MPLRLEAAILSRTRSPISSRSNWAKDKSTLSVSRPMLELVFHRAGRNSKERDVISNSAVTKIGLQAHDKRCNLPVVAEVASEKEPVRLRCWRDAYTQCSCREVVEAIAYVHAGIEAAPSKRRRRNGRHCGHWPPQSAAIAGATPNNPAANPAATSTPGSPRLAGAAGGNGAGQWSPQAFERAR